MPRKNRYSAEQNPRLDSTVVLIYILLCFIGLVNIYSATADPEQTFKFSFSNPMGKQLIWLGGSLIIILSISFSNIAVIKYSSYFIYGFTIFLNVLVLVIGREVSGAKSWFGFGGVGIQPGEFAKFGTSLALANWLGTYGVRFKGWKNVGITCGIFLLPMAIILKQNDTGTALVFLSFILVLYREGLPGWILLSAVWLGFLSILNIVFSKIGVSQIWPIASLLLIGTLIGIIFRKNMRLIILIGIIIGLSISVYLGVGFFYKKVLKDYQRNRIELVLNLKQDKKNEGYNLEQSKIAIGAGGFTGRGFLKGTQTKMGFVPEQHTDFIFCTIGEEWGTLGVIIFFSLYVGLLFRLLKLAERQSSTYGRVLGYSVLAILFTHLTVNVGMTIGIMPVIGIPLPFVSFGGSSLWAFTFLLFTFLKVDERKA